MNGGIDVVVPSAYPLRLLSRTLPALRTAAEETEDVTSVTIVDDRAPRSAVEQFAIRLGFAYVVGTGGGAGPARNVGAARGTADILLFVDDDVELDQTALVDLPTMFDDCGVVAVVGGLRPPSDAPDWLRWTYEDEVMTPASALARDRELPPRSFAAALVAIRRTAFAQVGGFADASGIEDSLFGLAVGRVLPHARVLRRGTLSGIHHYVPSWSEWLRRREDVGDLLADVVDRLPPEEAHELLLGHGLAEGPRATLKRIAGLLPPVLCEQARTRLLRKVASAAAEARGYRRSRAART